MNETELLFTGILDCDRLSLYQNRGLYLDKDKSSLIASALRRRIKGEPIQYILGETEFMGLIFKVDKNVFIPRPETEILVETAVNALKVSKCQSVKVLDLGTGSGCIAISLAKYLDNSNIIATDVSQEALNVAKENAKLNGVENKIIFLKSNLFESLTISDMPYAICVCNPPYIPTQEIKGLEPEVRFEPAIALDGGKDGLDFYRAIAEKSPLYLKEHGILIIEMGFEQRKAIENIFQKSGNFEIIEVVKDCSDIDRVIVTQKI